MEQTRVPNPITGRTDDGIDALPVTPLMLVGRYLLALLVPTGILIWQVTTGVSPRLPLLIGFAVVLYFVSAAAHGSWWRWAWPTDHGAGWRAVVLMETAVITLGLVVSAATGEPLVMAFAMTLLIGAVLGAAALHGWEVLRSRRRGR